MKITDLNLSLNDILLTHNPEHVVELDSKDEWHFLWWATEMMNNGLCCVHQPKTFDICPPVELHYNVEYKRKGTVSEQRALIPSIEYTPDFVLDWNTEHPLFDNVVLWDGASITKERDKPTKFFKFLGQQTTCEKIVSVIDVKPSTSQVFRNTSSSYTFFPKQHLMMLIFGLFVQKVKIKQLFKLTFIPDRYRLTDKTKQKRKLNIKQSAQKTFDQYVQHLQP